MKQSRVNLNMKYYELNVLGEIGGISGIQIFCQPVLEKKLKFPRNKLIKLYYFPNNNSKYSLSKHHYDDIEESLYYWAYHIFELEN